MIKSNKYNIFGQLLLLLATLLWGSSFLILKKTIDDVPPMFVVGIRFFISSVFLGLIFIKRIIKIDRETIKGGVILGITVALAYYTQTLGLSQTTPAKNAFLTTVYSIMCPFLLWLFFKKKPSIFSILCAMLCLVGIGFIVLSNSKGANWSQLLGDILTICSAVFFALQIIFTDNYGKKKDAVALLVIELFVTSLILLIYAFTVEGAIYGYNKFVLKGYDLTNVLYLTFACTLATQLCQMFGQKFANPGQSAIILSLEAVFGTLFSVIMGEEKLTPLLIIGFVIVFISIILTESEPFLFNNKKE